MLYFYDVANCNPYDLLTEYQQSRNPNNGTVLEITLKQLQMNVKTMPYFICMLCKNSCKKHDDWVSYDEYSKENNLNLTYDF